MDLNLNFVHVWSECLEIFALEGVYLNRKRIRELEVQNIDPQQEMSDTQGKLIACHDVSQRTKFANDWLPKIGLEPTYLSAPEPKSGVSTNSTTWAWSH